MKKYDDAVWGYEDKILNLTNQLVEEGELRVKKLVEGFEAKEKVLN